MRRSTKMRPMTNESQDDGAPTPESLIAAWGKIISSKFPYVLFANGTCVLLREPETDLQAQAIALLKEWGPVHPGTPSADFQVIELDAGMGAVIAGHHPDILVFVSLGKAEFNELICGMIGRGCRDADAEELSVIHVEPARE